MKTSIKSIVFILSIFVVSCSKPTDMLTVINEDGSCYREFTSFVSPEFLVGDTTNKSNPFPVKIDSTWEIQWQYGKSGIRTDFPISKATYDSLFQKKLDENLVVNSKKNSTSRFIKQNKSRVKVSVSIKVNSPAGQKLQDSVQRQAKIIEDSLQQEAESISSTGEEKGSDKDQIKVLVIARRRYASVDEMSKQFKLGRDHTWKNIKVNYKLEKQFRWFYTYFTYSETYPKINQQLEVPIEKYLTKPEAEFWFTGNKELIQGMNGVEIRELSGQIEDKYNTWFAQNSWNTEYKVLLANYKKIVNPPTSLSQLRELRDTIFSSYKNNLQDFKMKSVLNEYFKTDAFSVLWQGEDSPMKIFEKQYNDILLTGFSESFKYKLIMPGKITESNDAIVQGDTLSWRLTSYRMIPNDFKIEAQSRVANIWAFILSALVLVVAIGSFVWKPKRRV